MLAVGCTDDVVAATAFERTPRRLPGSQDRDVVARYDEACWRTWRQTSRSHRIPALTCAPYLLYT
jgi:hypothetical protein